MQKEARFWNILKAPPALRELKKLNPTARDFVLLNLQYYANTNTGDIQKLKVDHTNGAWRLRAGNYRVTFDKIDDRGEPTILVKSVRHRKDFVGSKYQ